MAFTHSKLLQQYLSDRIMCIHFRQTQHHHAYGVHVLQVPKPLKKNLLTNELWLLYKYMCMLIVMHNAYYNHMLSCCG